MTELAHSNLYSNIAKHDYLAFGQNGSFKSKAVADFLDFSPDDIKKISGVSTVRFDDRIPPAVLERLQQIGNICNLVAEAFSGDQQKTALWFKTHNPLLGNVTPRDMIRLGRYKKLLQFILDAREETQTHSKTA